jgi:branched-chain amino acid transport system permease protein
MLQQFLLNGIIAGSNYALVALGFTVIYSTVKFFNFAHGSTYIVGAYAIHTLTRSLHLAFIPAFFLSASIAGLVGIAVNRFVFLPLRQRKATNLVLLIASFGVYIFLQNLIQLFYGTQVLILRSGAIEAGYRVGGATITKMQVFILLISAMLALALYLFTQKTQLGKAMRAVADDPIAASVVGINSERIILWTFALGSALAGAAGILIALETNIEPTMGLNAILKGIIASIVGGIGSIPGAMLGGLFLGVVENLGIYQLDSGWKDSIAFAVLIFFLLLQPNGIMGRRSPKERL